MIKKLAWVFAIVLTLIGILGFVPGITSEGHLLGIFEVDTIHNIIHLVSGLVFLFAILKSTEAAKTVFKVFGIVYGLVAIVGLVQGDSVLGLFAVNAADHGLHIVIAALSLWVGFKKEAVPMVTNQPAM
jgi:hypothetical protein